MAYLQKQGVSFHEYLLLRQQDAPARGSVCGIYYVRPAVEGEWGQCPTAAGGGCLAGYEQREVLSAFADLHSQKLKANSEEKMKREQWSRPGKCPFPPVSHRVWRMQGQFVHTLNWKHYPQFPSGRLKMIPVSKVQTGFSIQPCTHLFRKGN